MSFLRLDSYASMYKHMCILQMSLHHDMKILELVTE